MNFIPRSRLLRVMVALLGAAAAAGFAPLAAQRGPARVPLPDIIPTDHQAAQLVLSTDTTRAYAVSPTGELWFFDHAKKTSVRLAAAEAWDLSLATTGTALAYSRSGVKHTDHTVWILPLNPRTGLAAGPERQLSSGIADAPAVSPDGQSVAFARDDATGVGQSVVVVPIGGGAERPVLRSLPAAVGQIRWTPDSKTLFVGVNKPVACDPDWSCLPLKPGLQQLKGSIQRVSVAGGAATTVATVAAVWPGLSPDGTLLVYGDTGRNRQAVIADAAGRRLQTLPLLPGETIQGWTGKATLVVSTQRTRWSLRRYSMADGTQGVLAESDESLAEPAPSPDGTLTSVVHCAGTVCQLRIIGLDGALRREVVFAEPYVVGNSWSPDQRWVACVTRAPDQTMHVNAIDAATGRITRMGDLPAGFRPMVLWLADSRTVVLAQDRIGTANERRTTFYQYNLDGQRRQLREQSIGTGQTGAFVVDGSSALMYRVTMGSSGDLPTTTFSRVRLDSASSERPFPLPPAYYYPPSFSADRNWLAVRSLQNEMANQGAFQVVRADGSSRRTVTLPFLPAFGLDNPIVLANGDQLLVRENAATGRDAGVYKVEVASGHATKLFAIPATERGSLFALSANGKTLIYLTSAPAAPGLASIDLADLIRAARP